MAIYRGTGGSSGSNSDNDSIVSAVTQKAAEAEGFRDEAEGFKDQAEGFKNTASSSATTATTKATEANTAKTGAETAKTGAETAKTAAESAKTAAEAARDTALVHANTANNTHVQTVSGIATEVQNLDSIKTDITGVNTIKSDVTTVAGISSNVTTVAADSSDIGTVATNITNVNNVGDNISNVNSVAGNATNINTVAADGTDIGTVASNISNVNTVAGISSDVTTVAGLESKMDTVIADASDIGAVANNIDDVSTVAGINSEVDTVAGISAKVTTVADNISDVQNADTNAANASASASQAANSATAASASATTASTKATEASNSATAASNSASTATTKATEAAGSATTATTKASEAASSATNAATSATTATTKASEAASSATAASGSATTATTKASEADASATSAASSATDSSNAASTWTNYYSTYLGAADAPPTADVQGNALQTGAFYYDTGAGSNTVGLYVYNGSSWVYSTNYNNVTAPYSLAQDLSTNNYDIRFGDDDKALFGAGNDLKIYHSANNESYIHEVGSGNLNILASSFKLQSGSGALEFLSTNASTGTLSLKNSGSTKLTTTATGIDVTGGMTATGNVGIGTSSPDTLLELVGADPILTIRDSEFSQASTNATLRLAESGGSDTLGNYWDINHTSNGQLRFVQDKDGANYERMRIDSTGKVGIGRTSPITELEVLGKITASVNNNGGFGFNRGGSFNQVLTKQSDDAVVLVNKNNSPLLFKTNNSERMRIDSSGNVVVGKTAASTTNTVGHELDVDGHAEHVINGTTTANALMLNRKNTDGGFIDFRKDNTTVGSIGTASSGITFASGGSTERMRIDSSGNVGIGTASPSTSLDVRSGTTNKVASFSSTDATTFIQIKDSNTTASVHGYGVNGNTLSLYSNNSERMRIDNSGNVVVGKTSVGVTVTGIEARADGLLVATRDGDNTALFNRNTSDGTIVQFRKDNTTVGSIGVLGSRPYFASTNCGIRLGAADLLPATNSGAISDNVVNLGSSAGRWKDLYLSGGAYLGGTGSANKLDDYEEGTWTPIIDRQTTSPSVTYGTQTGKYTKIGRVVHASFLIQITAVASNGSGRIQVGGLPFNAVATEASGATFYRLDGWDISATGQFSSQITGGTAFRITDLKPDGNVTLFEVNPKLGYIIGHITFETNS